MGLEARISSTEPCEVYAEKVLYTYFPHACIQFERDRIDINGEVTLPDFVFCLPGAKKEVFLEFTKSPLLPWHDKKKRQREILQKYVEKHTQYGALVLYLQNLISIKTLDASLDVLAKLAGGEMKSIPAQKKIDQISLESNLFPRIKSSEVNWDLLYKSVVESRMS